MTIKYVEKSDKRLRVCFASNWRWFFWILGVPLFGAGLLGLTTVFDRVSLRCDRGQDNCILSSRQSLSTKTFTFKVTDVQSIRRNRRNIGLILEKRDLLIWHDRIQTTAELEQIETRLQEFFRDRAEPNLALNYRNIKDSLIPSLFLMLLGGVLSLWLGRMTRLVIDRQGYRAIVSHIFGGIPYGLPLWHRERSLDLIELFQLVPNHTPLGRKSFEAQMQLKSGKIIPLTTVMDVNQGQQRIEKLNTYLQETHKPVQPIQSNRRKPLTQFFRNTSANSMSLRLYNTLSRQKEPFETLQPNQVKMYCCGVTVYDYCHLGHARSYIVWDVVRRYLIWLGMQVTYVQNFTDIDDKILKRAQTENSSMETVSEKYIEAYYEDMDRLNILRADEYPRATHTLDGIKRLIHELEHKGVAYAAEGDVYYSVRKFDSYGKLSGRKLDDMQAGASGRVDMKKSDDEKKKDPFDFALWKAAKPGEPSWESEWGEGRPGWHIECSAMVRDRLGDRIDIHMGGADLCFPHHENEIAQSEGVTGEPLASYWMHNGMVNVGGEKMSKSLGNFTTIRDLLDNPLPALDNQNFDPMALRLFVLQAQYRKPIDFTDEAVKAAQQGWQTLKEGLLFGWHYGEKLAWETSPPSDDSFSPHILATDDNSLVVRFKTAMNDDFNATEALAILFELAKPLKRAANLIKHDGKLDDTSESLHEKWNYLVGLAAVLGLAAQPDTSDATAETGLTDDAIAELIEKRKSAKASKNYAEADQIRDDLKQQGIQLIDKAGGITDWIRE